MGEVIAEYIWIDGTSPTPALRSKAKVLDKHEDFKDLPIWGFDGSSTEQAATDSSDCVLRPVKEVRDLIRGTPHILVLCEVFNLNGTPHKSNTRARLRETADRFKSEEPLFGIEQEYTLFDARGERPFSWPKEGFPAPQGPYYCGVGANKVYGRSLVEAHLQVCLMTGLKISGINAEVMPGQWEFQVGPLPPLEVADELWLARWLLHRIGEDFEATVKLDPKPMDGDWNGAGAHTNFSTVAMREEGGLDVITKACEKLKTRHAEHIKVYGADNDKRLTGKHETCDINTFRWGVGHRGASVRIPAPVAKSGCGYLEDRRPAANMDPYQVCTALLETICGDGFRE